MMELIKILSMKRRDIICDGFDESLSVISKEFPLKIHKIKTGTKCWTWTIPKKWEIKDAYIDDSKGNRLLDLKDHPLHVVSYSLPINKIVSKDELMKHLYTKPNRPNAIPFEFKYYDKDWGFCIEHNKLKEFTDDKYKVYIGSMFEDGYLKLGDITIKGKNKKTILLMSHLCHPAMVNDNLSGVAILVDIAKILASRKNNYTYKILFVPETIGSIAYLSQNEDVIPSLKCGIFLDMLGNDNEHTLQFSRQDNEQIDRIAKSVMITKLHRFNTVPYLKRATNDEKVINGPGVDVPMVAINRYPYPEYHTSDDNVNIMSEDKLTESKNLILDIIDILDNNYTPKRKFKGPVFLSGYGLWVDKKVNMDLNKAIEQIMLRMNGDKTIFDISLEVGLKFKDVLNYVNKFYDKKLIKKVW
jgi:aminopeptidase-like protein